jgi:hypothetical protein
MHSSGIFAFSGRSPGFDVYSFGTGNVLLKNFIHSITSTTVPIFFILWGVLSKKYVSDNSPAKVFILAKFFQFYPLYFVSMLLGVANVLLTGANFDKDIHVVILSAFGIAPYFFGAHIVYPLIICIMTIAAFKKINCVRKYQVIYFIVLFIGCSFIYHYNDSFWIKYLIFYIAFLLGVIFDMPKALSGCNEMVLLDRVLFIALTSMGVLALISNTFSLGIVSSNIHSGSTLAISFIVLQGYFFFAKRILLYMRNSFLIKAIAVIGNNAYSHFIIHYHVLNLLFSISSFCGLSDFLTQIVLISFTSAISVFIVNPIWIGLYKITFLKLQNILTNFLNYLPMPERES